MKSLIRTGIVLGEGIIALVIALTCSVPVMFLLAPAILALVHTLLWDVLKLDALENGFFRFLKLAILIATFVILIIIVAPTSSNMITAELFALDAPYTDIQIISTTGAIAMLVATFSMCLVCMESFGNRYVTVSVPVVGIGFGLLYGLVVYFLGAISPDFSRVLAWAILALDVIGLFSYIKKYGLLYDDLDHDAKFQGFGLKKGGGGKKYHKTGRPIDDAMNFIAYKESKFLDLYYNNKLSIEVDVTIYTTEINFVINGKLYNNNPNMTIAQIREVSDQVNNILQNAQRRISTSAKRDVETILNNDPNHYNANIGYNIFVNVGDIRQ
jgi:hypothetical protein